ncbi:hypothetical protein ATERTT37_006237 [Aspergillus terreus]
MSYSLRDRNALITGGSRGLGALVAQKFAAEGCNVAINYMSSKDAAEKLASELQAQYKVKVITVQGVGPPIISTGTNADGFGLQDASRKDDCINAVRTTIAQLGGLDIVVSNAGWTKMTNFADLDAMDDDDWDKCWTTNVKGHFYLFKEALPTFNANPDGGPEVEDTANAFVMLAKNASMTGQGIQIDSGFAIK